MGVNILMSFLLFFQLTLDQVRNNYTKAVNDKQVCELMIKELENSSNNDVSLAYLGAFQTIWANHVINPLSKYNTFVKGKKNIEKAVKSSPNNIEIRFLRYSVQKNAPSFLGYNDNITEDLNYIKKHKNTVDNMVLKKLISNL